MANLQIVLLCENPTSVCGVLTNLRHCFKDEKSGKQAGDDGDRRRSGLGKSWRDV